MVERCCGQKGNGLTKNGGKRDKVTTGKSRPSP